MTETALTSQTVETTLGPIHVSQVGEGTPFVMLHGGGPGANALANYRANLPAFERMHVVLPDQPGFGGSYFPTEEELVERSITEIAVDALYQTLDALGIGEFNLMGNSLGGAAALGMAIAQPERVKKLVLMAPGGGWLPTSTPLPTEGQKEMFRYYNGEGPTLKKMKNFIRVMVADAKQISDEEVQARYEGSLDPEHIEFYHRYNVAFGRRGGMDPLWKDLEKITADTLLLWGRDDRTITLDGASIMLKRIRNVQMHVFGNCGHWVQVERKAEFERLVVDFLETA